jgi:hypothetical protein
LPGARAAQPNTSAMVTGLVQSAGVINSGNVVMTVDTGVTTTLLSGLSYLAGVLLYLSQLRA